MAAVAPMTRETSTPPNRLCSSLFRGSTIGPIAEQEDECGGGSGRKYAPKVKLATSGALVPHRQRPDGKENGANAVTRPAAGRKDN
jgi:hypothetical protein